MKSSWISIVKKHADVKCCNKCYVSVLQLTRVWEKLSAHKKVLVESRVGDREDFDHMMKMFYEVVKDPSCSDDEYGKEKSEFI